MPLYQNEPTLEPRAIALVNRKELAVLTLPASFPLLQDICATFDK